MAAPKITTFIVMLIVFMMILAGGLGGLISQLAINYNPDGYNQSQLDRFNKLDEIVQDTEEIKNESLALQSKSGITDVLGGFFESAYNALKITFGSFEIFKDLTDNSFDSTQIDRAEVYKAGIITIVLVMIVIGIIIAAAIKRDL